MLLYQTPAPASAGRRAARHPFIVGACGLMCRCGRCINYPDHLGM